MSRAGFLRVRADAVGGVIWTSTQHYKSEGSTLVTQLHAGFVLTGIRKHLSNTERPIDSGDLLKHLAAENDEWVCELSMCFAAFAGAYVGFSNLLPSWKWPFLFDAERQWMIPFCTYTAILGEGEPSSASREIIRRTMREIGPVGYREYQPHCSHTP